MKVSWAIPIILSILILGGFGFSQDASAVTFTLSNQESCEDLGVFATSTNWDGTTQTCTITGDATVNDASPDEFEFVIPDGVTLHIIQDEPTGFATFTINDKVTNNGHVKMTLDLEGSIVGFNHVLFSNNDEFVNNGKISMLGEDFVIIGLPNNRVEFENHGVFLNNGELEIDNLNKIISARLDFMSDGEFVNSCTGEIRLGQISGSIQSVVDISGTFKNGGIYSAPLDPDIHDDTVLCITAKNTIDTLTAANVALQELIANFSVLFVLPILNAVDALIVSGGIDPSEEGSLTRTLERSLSTAERADGVACTGAAALFDDVNNLIATTDLTEIDAEDLLTRAQALLDTCI